jgi:hypothetical protein
VHESILQEEATHSLAEEEGKGVKASHANLDVEIEKGTCADANLN